MKKIILIMAMVLMASVSWAAPFLICDPQAGVTLYKFSPVPPATILPTWMPASVAAQPDGSIRLDVGTATIGESKFNVVACWTIAPWGEQCSVAVPFVFTRPSVPATTSNIRLTP